MALIEALFSFCEQINLHVNGLVQFWDKDDFDTSLVSRNAAKAIFYKYSTKSDFILCIDRSQSVFYFVPQENLTVKQAQLIVKIIKIFKKNTLGYQLLVRVWARAARRASRRPASFLLLLLPLLGPWPFLVLLLLLLRRRPLVFLLLLVAGATMMMAKSSSNSTKCCSSSGTMTATWRWW